MTHKEALRAANLERRRALPEDERQSAGRDMGFLFSGFAPFKCRSCCAYLSHDNEIPSRHLIRQALAWNAACAVPAWDPATKSYQFCAFHAQTRLVKGRNGIREPEHRILVDISGIQLLLIPGVAFATAGNRVGHGKGYYDAILAQAAPQSIKVGVCYDWQITSVPIPAESHDIPVDFLLTNRRVHCCNPAKLALLQAKSKQ
jgi:5-formyltetrahydrofolate cyclo-ligase